MDSLFLSSFLILASICEVHSYASGAPEAACVSLMPSHGVTPQTSTSPYSINVSSTTYEPNQQITVTITGPSFQGLLIQARLFSGNTAPTGTFSSPPTNTKTTQCTVASDSWTHSNTIGKVSASVTWTAPSQDMSDIIFMGTVAQSKLTYWVGLQSEPLAFMQPTTQSIEETTSMSNNVDETTTMSNHGVEETTTMSNAGDETTTMSNDGGGTTTAYNNPGVSTVAINNGGDTSTANHNAVEETTTMSNNADETTTMSNHGGYTTTAYNYPGGEASTVSNNADETTMSNNEGGTTITGNSGGQTSTVSNNAGGTTIVGNNSEVMTTPDNGSTRLGSSVCLGLGVLLVAASIM